MPSPTRVTELTAKVPKVPLPLVMTRFLTLLGHTGIACTFGGVRRLASINLVGLRHNQRSLVGVSASGAPERGASAQSMVRSYLYGSTGSWFVPVLGYFGGS